MKYTIILLPLAFTTLFFIGCDENKEIKNSVVINEVERTITKKDTSFGCKDKGHNSVGECSENKDSAKFILSTLAKESQSEEETNISSIKENLNKSLEEITQQEKQKSKLKENLIALVDAANQNRRKDLQSFISNIETEDVSKSGIASPDKILSIKEELNSLIKLEESPVSRPKEVKERLESLISNINESKKNLLKTKETLQNLVNKVETTDSSSVKKFATAIIEDVSNNKISIIEENKNYFIIKVQEGDNLSILAKRYYNNTDKYKLIYEANKDKINSKYEIYPGSKLLIPKI